MKIVADEGIERPNEYPQLTPEGIKAALKFAAESIRFDHITPFSAQSQEDEIEKSSPQE